MKRTILFITLSSAILMGANAAAQTDNNPKIFDKPIKEQKLKKMDKHLTKHKAVKRKFRTQKEFKRMHHKDKAVQRKMHQNRAATKHLNQEPNVKRLHRNYGYGQGWYRDDYLSIRQHGYRHTNRGWYLAFRYDRASFYDKYGYYYGYFNRYGYYFEDIFYRYDRYYSYRDRVRGRGLFDHRYYMPANYRHYGFCKPRYDRRDYRR